jgi:predicted nucleic acid-binding protein
MAEFLLDSDVVIWHLRGHAVVAEYVLNLARRGRIGVSAITRAEVLQGMREPERKATFGFLTPVKRFLWWWRRQTWLRRSSVPPGGEASRSLFQMP